MSGLAPRSTRTRPHQLLVVDDGDPDHACSRRWSAAARTRGSRRPARRRTPGDPPQDPRSLRQPDQPVAAGAPWIAGGRARSGVRHLEVEGVPGVGHGPRAPPPARVLEHVGQRLLHDPVGRQSRPRVERAAVLRCRRRDRRHARRRDVVDQRVEVVEPLHRRGVGPVASSRSSPSSRPGLGRAPSRLVSAITSRARAGGVRVGRGSRGRRRRPAPRSATCVRHHVVQLARDPQPFLGDGTCRLLAGARRPPARRPAAARLAGRVATGWRPRPPRPRPAARRPGAGQTVPRSGTSRRASTDEHEHGGRQPDDARPARGRGWPASTALNSRKTESRPM